MIYPSGIETEIDGHLINQKISPLLTAQYDTRERQLRAALVKMGWTPPADVSTKGQRFFWRLAALCVKGQKS